MDIENRLRELTQETLSFGNVINTTENHGSLDFQNACSLFSQYLNNQLSTINTSPVAHHSYLNIKTITEQLRTLSNLIAQGQLDSANTKDWSNKLIDFCSQLQLHKSNAA